jgi:hypothetical protein
MSSPALHTQIRCSVYKRIICITSVFLIAGVAYTHEATGISKCSTQEIRKLVLDKMLAALQCSDYVCGRYSYSIIRGLVG